VSAVNGLSLPSGDVTKVLGVEGTCSACMLGKMTSQPYTSKGHTVSCPLKKGHADLMGPIKPESYVEEKYAPTIINEF
jgi:hypothetical protein